MNVSRICWRRSVATRSQPNSTRCISTPTARDWRIPALTNPNLDISTEDQRLTKNGIPGLYSRVGLKYAWTDQQLHTGNGYIERLAEANEKTEDIDLGAARCKHDMQKYARHAQHAGLFNYASMLWNNDFYFRGINYDPEPSVISDKLTREIETHFGTMATLKSTFLANASTMFGGGFVWLVATEEKHTGNKRPVMKILRTYNAGSPYAGNHWRRQDSDMSEVPLHPGVSRSTGRTASDIARYIERDAQPKVHPVLCVSVWEHSYIVDWQIGGKDQFLEAWWNRIDWDKVYVRARIDYIEETWGRAGTPPPSLGPAKLSYPTMNM